MTTTVTAHNPHRWFIVAAVMLSTVMEILDTTIVNVSLPHMMGSLSADRNEISWVLTSYIVAAGVLMPLTGFLVNRIGRQRLLLINIIGFMCASALCGTATSLAQMVAFRLLQGVFGASLMPLSQFILRDSFSQEEQPKMMAIWGIGVMAAPVMGPTLGGYITDWLNWRWIFYLNIPICLINAFLVLRFIDESPRKKDAIDWKGMILLVVSTGALQLFLDRGDVDDWLESTSIRWLVLIFLVTFGLFLKHCFTQKNTIINLRFFKDNNFAFSTLMVSCFSAAVFGCLPFIPQFVESLLGYSSELAGLSMASRGIASAIMMGVSSRLLFYVDARWLLVIGLTVCAIGAYMMSCVTLDINMGFIVLSGFIQGLGIGCFFLPLNTIIYSTLPKHAVAEAAGLFSFGRSIGNAMGISLFTTYLHRQTQANWNTLSSHLNPANPNLTTWLSNHHTTLNDPLTVARLGHLLDSQANFVAYVHLFDLSAMILTATLCWSVFLTPPKYQRSAAAAMH